MTYAERFCHDQIQQWLNTMLLLRKAVQVENPPLLGVTHGVEKRHVVDLISGLLSFNAEFYEKLMARDSFDVILSVIPAYDPKGKLLGYVVQRPIIYDTPCTSLVKGLCGTPKEARAE